jgi:hypothetical protein
MIGRDTALVFGLQLEIDSQFKRAKKRGLSEDKGIKEDTE